MSTNQPRVGEQRPGGRAERVRYAVLRAATDLLGEVGYENMSIEDVAERAGVHKTTVYRRWPTKADLTADANSLHSDEAVPIPDTGSLVDDLQLLARAVVANIGSREGARRARSIVAAAATSEELATTMHSFWSRRIALSTEIIERAIRRGELASSTDPKLVIEAVVAPLWTRLLLSGEPVTEQLADEVVDLVTSGLLRTSTD